MAAEAVELYHEVWERSGASTSSDDPAPVVLLHGLGSSSADWFLQRDDFSARHRVIAVDLRGHGRSPWPATPLSVAGMADDVVALLDRLGIASAHVIGLSLGGCVALVLAGRAPWRVRSLTVVNTFGRYAPAGPRGLLLGLVRLFLLLTAPMPVVARHVARGLFPRPDQEALYRRAVASIGRTSRRVYLSALRAVGRFDARPSLAAIRCPTLVVAGERDATVPLSAKQVVARSIQGARLVVVPDSGHATNVDRPDVFNRVVLDFLAGC